MAGRNAEVSSEAEQTGKHAAEVRENAAELNSAMAELRRSVSGRGSDMLTGGAGDDRFEFSGFNGNDTIVDFQQGLDKTDILGYALDKFGDLAGHISQVGADTHVDLGGAVAGAGIIVLRNTQMASLSSSDFAFK